MKNISVIELFAGVGGFRIGLERVNSKRKNNFYQTIWSNQWEPATKTQHASRTYKRVFGEDNHVNEDIALVKSSEIPVHDMLVGGFPCQDYSVARSLNQAVGIEGKKGVLWWQIERIIREKGENKPKILFLENVDRLIISPASQRGRDFAIILQSLSNLGYAVEWRIINAADYGMPQRRRRTYMLGYLKDSSIYDSIKDPMDWILKDGVFASAFPVKQKEHGIYNEPSIIKQSPGDDLADISESFNKKNKIRPFSSCGIMIEGKYWTLPVEPDYHGSYTLLKDVLVRGDDRKYISDSFYINDKDLPQWEYLKGSKHEERKTKDGYTFTYSEGSMPFPDPIDKPSRTIITSEGGPSPSRFKHVICDPSDGKLRRLIPLELERLDMFPDNHTLGETDTKRAFFMGNALVCGIVTAVGEELEKRLI